MGQKMTGFRNDTNYSNRYCFDCNPVVMCPLTTRQNQTENRVAKKGKGHFSHTYQAVNLLAQQMHYKKVCLKEEKKKESREMMRLRNLLIMISLLAVSGEAMATTTDKAFNITLNLFQAITITKAQDLLFPEQVITGSSFDVTVATGDTGAASFSAVGTANRSITRSVVESSIGMSNGTSTIAVDTFTFAGPTSFNGSGNATGLKVGGTAHILNTSTEGNYSGSGTYRVVYN